MNIIIIEDEKPAARLLQRKLSKINIEVQTLLHSVEEAIAWFQNNDHPDLIFLDIQLSDGLSFEIFEKVTIKSAVIFTTAYDEYALKAFKLNSIDYLLKPIDESDLETAVLKFQSTIKQTEKSASIDFDEIKKMFANQFQKQYKTRFTIKIGQQLKVISNTEIACFYSENKGTYLHTLENRSYLIEGTLDVLELELDPKQFFRVNRKFIIPISTIKEILIYSNSRLKVVLKGYQNEEIIVARERVSEFKDWLQ